MDRNLEEDGIEQGDIAFGRYRIQKLLGTGAFGEVYLAELISLKTNRALKCINKCQDTFGTARREADILKNLRHPAIPIIYDIEEDEETICVVEEYIAGESLNSFISTKKSISVNEAAEIILKLCEVMSYLHDKGIVHHDLKPENIIYDGKNIKLLDYGSAASVEGNPEYSMGTRGYAAPEMYERNKSNAGNDIYSIGIIMLVLLTGEKNENALKYVHNKSLRAIIERCLSHSMEGRPDSVKKLGQEIQKLIKNRSLSEHEVLSICFAGAYEHCGVTYCALAAAKILAQAGYVPLVCEEKPGGDFFALIKEAKRVKFEKGVYRVDGINICPYYSGCVNPEYLREYDAILYDRGTIDMITPKLMEEYRYFCIVTGGRPYEAARTDGLIKTAGDKLRELYVLINFCSGKMYKDIIDRYCWHNTHRVVYFPDLNRLDIKKAGVSIVKKSKKIFKKYKKRK